MASPTMGWKIACRSGGATALIVTAFQVVFVFARSTSDAIRSRDGVVSGRRRRRVAATMPELVGEWSRIPDFPLDVGESQGVLLGCDLFSVGGFFPNFASGPTVGHALDLCDPDADWRSLADSETKPFLTHGAHAHKGDNLFFMCGGYNGTHAGKSINNCYVFDKADGPIGSWKDMPALPVPRGAGGMIYIESLNRLVFTLGAVRPNTNTDGIDKDNTWTLDLDGLNLNDVTAGSQWKWKGGGPYLGNHVTAIAAKDCSGNTRYYFLGGQIGERERDSNIDLVFEYLPSSEQFEQRQSMPDPRGHFTTAIAAYGCGFIVVGGAINGDPAVNTWSDDVLYYDIDSDTWTSIGTYPELIKTPVCGIVSDVLYCANGYTVHSYKIKLAFGNLLANVDFDGPPGTSYGFELVKDMFVDGDEQFTGGYFVGAKGRPNELTGDASGGLFIKLGGTSNAAGFDMSAGFRYSFATEVDVQLRAEFDYRVIWPSQYDDDENSHILFGLDGSSVFDIDYFDSSSPRGTTDWRTATVDVGLVKAGQHYADIGGTNNKKDNNKEKTSIYLDNVRFWGEPVTSSLVPLLEADFNTGVNGFSYVDDAFYGTSEPDYAKGVRQGTGGRLGSGCLNVKLGGVNNQKITGISGAWAKTFEVAQPSSIHVAFDVKVIFPAAYDTGEYLDVLLAVDGTLGGTAGSDSVVRYFGGQGGHQTTFETLSVEVGMLASGSHSLTLGAYNNQKTTASEQATILFDNIVVSPSEGSTVHVFDVDFNQGAGSEYGFALVKDMFADGDEQFTSGYYVGVKGKPDEVSGSPTGGLFVQLGGFSGAQGLDMSAGFRRSFGINVDLRLFVQFDYQVVWSSKYDNGEFSYVKLGIDGETEFDVDFFDLTSPSGAGPWKTASVDVGIVKAGTHFLDVGGLNNKKNQKAEKTLIYIDNVVLWGTGMGTREVPNAPTPVPTLGPTTRLPTPSPTVVPQVILDVDFDNPSGTSGFALTRDMFTDGDEQFTSGYFVGSKGKPDELTGGATAGLRVQLGGTSSDLGEGMSAGFRRVFTTGVDFEVRVQFDYQVFWPSAYDDGDNCRVMLGINGASLFVVDYFDNSSPTGTTTWRTATVDVGKIRTGFHYVDIGGTNNKKDHKKERTIIYIDNVRLTGRATSTKEESAPTGAPSLPSTCRTIDTSRTYRIISRKTGKPIQVKNGSTALGAEIAQNLMGDYESFMWTFQESDNGRYRIVNKKTNYEMRVASASLVKGAKIIQAAIDTSLSNGNWCLKGSGDGYYKIVVDHSGFVMDLPDSNRNVKQTITQRPYKDFLDQQWFITPVDTDWGDRHVLGLVPVAAANLPDGRVLTWSAYKPYGYNSGFGKTYTSIFDPTTGQATETVVENTSHDMFCPGTAILPDSRVMITGGSDKGTDAHQTTFYDPQTNVWSSGPLLNIPRGYHAMAVLTDGSVFTLGGSFSHSIGGKDGEVWDVNTNMWVTKPNIVSNGSVLTNDFQGVYSGDNHMWLFTAPNGLVFHAGPSKQMHWIDPKGDGSMLETILRGDHGDAMNGNAVMYDTGKIFVAGGSRHYRSGPANDRCYVIDINGGIGGVSVTRQGNMASERTLGNSVVLPSGEIIVVGGTRKAKIFSDQDAVMFVEIWSPKTGEFAKLDDMSIPRTYHSFALLLKDGRVLSGGGGLCGEDCAFNHFDMQIFTPPYLLKADGTPRQRPMILVAPDSAVLGEQITVTMNVGSIRTFALTRLGAVTHSINNDARRIPVSFVRSGGKDFHLSIPENGSIALPGVYHLFALNTLGVPSIATILSISAGS